MRSIFLAIPHVFRALTLGTAMVALASCADAPTAAGNVTWNPPEWDGHVIIYTDQAASCPAQVPFNAPFPINWKAEALADGYAHLQVARDGRALVFSSPMMNGESATISPRPGIGEATFGTGLYNGQHVVITSVDNGKAHTFQPAAAPYADYPQEILAEVQDRLGKCLYRVLLWGSQTGIPGARPLGRSS